MISVKLWYDRQTSLLFTKIRDTGIGISRFEIPMLFSKFGKLERTAEKNSEGIGLGLLICKQLVEQNGGTIKVRSEGEN